MNAANTNVEVSYLSVGHGGENDEIRFHHYHGSIRVTELRNAGKRDKEVREFSLRYMGKPNHTVLSLLRDLPELGYLSALVMAEVAEELPVSNFNRCSVETRILKSINVKPAGFKTLEFNNGNVYVKADFDTFTIKNLRDRVNGSTCMPPARRTKTVVKDFYKWMASNPDFGGEATYLEVLRLVTDAGIRYHSYCAA